jgi:hypothetical protein
MQKLRSVTEKWMKNVTLNFNCLAFWQNKPENSFVSDNAFKYVPIKVYFIILFASARVKLNHF